MTLRFDIKSISPISVGRQPVVSELSISPTTSLQTVVASDGVDGYSPINVGAVTATIDANIVAENIKDGVSILGVTGNYSGGGDTITATNNTGASISSGDKVWVCKDTGNPDFLLRAYTYIDQYAYTGFALESGADGASVDVETILPDSITITLSTTADDAYLNVR